MTENTTIQKLHQQVETLKADMAYRLRHDDLVTAEHQAQMLAGISDAQAQEIEALRAEIRSAPVTDGIQSEPSGDELVDEVEFLVDQAIRVIADHYAPSGAFRNWCDDWLSRRDRSSKSAQAFVFSPNPLLLRAAGAAYRVAWAAESYEADAFADANNPPQFNERFNARAEARTLAAYIMDDWQDRQSLMVRHPFLREWHQAWLFQQSQI